MSQEKKSVGFQKNQRKNQREIVFNPTQPAFTCSKLTIETLEQGVKYVQS